MKKIASPLVADMVKRCVHDSSDAIMITDAAGTLRFVNASWIHLYGYPEEEALGQTPSILHSGFHSPAFYKTMWSEILDPNIGFWRGEIVNRAKSGHLVNVLLSISAYRSDEGKILGYMGLAVDLTEKKMIERKLLHQDRLVVLGEMAAGLAHEVGNPLGVIRGRAELLQMEFQEVEKLNSGLGTIIGQIDRISAVIQTMLKLGRDESQVPVEQTHLASVLKETDRLLEQRLEKRNIRLEVNLEDGLPPLLTRPSLLQQILLNLLLNAMQEIEKHRKGEQTAQGRIRLTVFRLGGGLALDVEDNGGGVPEDLKMKIFRPFFTTKIGTSTGLGLAIVEKLLDSLGGRIELRSPSGELGGACFRISLPFKENLRNEVGGLY